MDKVEIQNKKRLFLIFFKFISLAFIIYIIIGIIFFEPETESLGGGYKCQSVAGYHITGPEITIPPRILNYSYDNRFIIVKQRLDGNPAREYSDWYDYNYPFLHETYYWIIDKKERIYYGPMLFKQYKERSDSLKLKLIFKTENEKEYSNRVGGDH